MRLGIRLYRHYVLGIVLSRHYVLGIRVLGIHVLGIMLLSRLPSPSSVSLSDSLLRLVPLSLTPFSV